MKRLLSLLLLCGLLLMPTALYAEDEASFHVTGQKDLLSMSSAEIAAATGTVTLEEGRYMEERAKAVDPDSIKDEEDLFLYCCDVVYHMNSPKLTDEDRRLLAEILSKHQYQSSKEDLIAKSKMLGVQEKVVLLNEIFLLRTLYMLL